MQAPPYIPKHRRRLIRWGRADLDLVSVREELRISLEKTSTPSAASARGHLEREGAVQ